MYGIDYLTSRRVSPLNKPHFEAMYTKSHRVEPNVQVLLPDNQLRSHLWTYSASCRQLHQMQQQQQQAQNVQMNTAALASQANSHMNSIPQHPLQSIAFPGRKQSPPAFLELADSAVRLGANMPDISAHVKLKCLEHKRQRLLQRKMFEDQILSAQRPFLRLSVLEDKVHVAYASATHSVVQGGCVLYGLSQTLNRQDDNINFKIIMLHSNDAFSFDPCTPRPSSVSPTTPVGPPSPPAIPHPHLPLRVHKRLPLSTGIFAPAHNACWSPSILVYLTFQHYQ
ncbi:hypothetical protein F4604DRAFT_1673931 [Suillus subluteus]|nr:hypothetical protein F4604DRAFT_1673931 [Suillus subluteus]